MDWIESTWAKRISWFASVSSLLAILIPINSINWIIENWTVLTPLFSFLFFSVLLLLHYYRKRKKYSDVKFDNLEEFTKSLEKCIEELRSIVDANKKDIKRIDPHVGGNWQHIKNISTALNKILEKEGEETLNI